MAGESALSVLLSLAMLAGVAQAEPTPEDWRYLQRIHAISQVNEAVWNSLEDQNAWDPEIATYARAVNAANLEQLQRWRAPRREYSSFHRDLTGILESLDDFYAAIGASDLDRARALAARVERQMASMEDSWQRIESTLP